MLELINSIRAKSDGDKLLLKDHIFETIDKVLKFKEFVKNNDLQIKEMDGFFESLVIAAFIHDLGKINYNYQNIFYQNQIPEELGKFLRNTKNIDLRHEILSSIWCSLLLKENDDWSKKIRTAVLLHHYNDFYINEKDLDEIFQNYPEIEKYVDFIHENWSEIESFLKDLIESTIRNFESNESAFIRNALQKISISIDRVDMLKKRLSEKVDIGGFAEFYEIDNENPNYEFLVFLGALRRCDYSASGNFNIEMLEATLDEIFSKIYRSIEEKRKEWGSFWQLELLNEIGEDSLVLIAPTGSGKTEFALLWGNKILRKFIYTVPLRVALNDLYIRFRGYVGDSPKDVLGLLHSTAFLEYLKEQKYNKELDVGSKVSSSNILAHPITLATPDQVFLTSLNYYGSDKVISIYPYSAFVLDEIQSYTPEMAAIIIKTLKIIEMLGGKILVMTATLPKYYIPFFSIDKLDLRKYDEKQKRILEEYKLNSKICDSEKIKNKVKNYELRRHKIQAVEGYLVEYNKNKIKVNEDILMNLISKLRSNGKKSIFVILNNVSKAIAVYEKLERLKEENNDSSVFLLHSRLIEKEKEDRINEIKNKIGKENVIVVSTQIVEASVDLDFDAMITEISPIDSQIQRWGRIYRNRNDEYSDKEPNIYVFIGEKDKNGERKFDKGTLAIYGRDVGRKVLEKTAEKIENISGALMNYNDERKLIEEVFNSNVDGKGLWELYFEEILKTLDFLNYFSVEKKSQAQRIFREIAGLQVVIPFIMNLENNSSWKKLYEIMKSENKNITWTNIEEKTGMNKWEIKSALYSYSVNTPIYYFQTLQNKRKLTEFKGFYILDEEDENSANIIRKYGLDKYIKEVLKEKDEEDYLLEG